MSFCTTPATIKDQFKAGPTYDKRETKGKMIMGGEEVKLTNEEGLEKPR